MAKGPKEEKELVLMVLQGKTAMVQFWSKIMLLVATHVVSSKSVFVSIKFEKGK